MYLNRMSEHTAPLSNVSTESGYGLVGSYSVATTKMTPTEILARRSIGEFQSTRAGMKRKAISVMELNTAKEPTLAYYKS